MKQIIIERKLTQDTLTALAKNRIHAIRIKNFYPADIAQDMCKRMINSPLCGHYKNAPLIGRIGQALYENNVSNKTYERYWKNSTAWVQHLRKICTPYLTPIDKLRLELDEAWPAGATQGIIDGRKAFVGLARIFEPGSLAESHQDVLSWDLPKSKTAKNLWGQLAANIYLCTPPKGGELILWGRELSKREYKQIQNSKSYGVDRNSLSDPLVTIRPKEGELILFNSRQLHAVESPKEGRRITWSCFIGLNQQKDKPLLMWS